MKIELDEEVVDKLGDSLLRITLMESELKTLRKKVEKLIELLKQKG